MKEGLVVGLDGFIQLIGGVEADVLCRVTKLGEDVFSVAALAEDVVDMFEVLEVAPWEALLVGDQKIFVC